MNLKELIIDSLKYSASNWPKVILLGIVILIADFVNEPITSYYSIDAKIFLIILGTILGILEAGFMFRILEESTKGSTKLPKLNRIKELFIHGFNETIVSTIYEIIPLAFLVVFLITAGSGVVDINLSFGINFSLLFILSIILYAIYPAILLNMANNKGTIRSAFNIRKIIHKLKKIGFRKLIIVYLGILIVVGLATVLISNELKTDIPLIGELVSDLIIIPYAAIFTFRFLGLIDEPI